MIIDALGWIALVATCIAALLTAANLGARITGAGFAVFFVGALAWCVVGYATGQRQLLLSNAFLALVDLFGVWRWFYHRARADDAVDRVKDEEECRAPLFALDELIGKPLRGRNGIALGTVQGALADGATGRLRFLVVKPESAIASEDFLRLAWRRGLTVSAEAIECNLLPHDLAAALHHDADRRSDVAVIDQRN